MKRNEMQQNEIGNLLLCEMGHLYFAKWENLYFAK